MFSIKKSTDLLEFPLWFYIGSYKHENSMLATLGKHGNKEMVPYITKARAYFYTVVLILRSYFNFLEIKIHLKIDDVYHSL